MRAVVKYAIEQGVIPVLSTKPDQREGTEQVNEIRAEDRGRLSGFRCGILRAWQKPCRGAAWGRMVCT